MTSIGEKFNGIGMTSTRTRTRMVERLREQGIKDEAVLAAMAAVPRHIFVEDALAIRAYDDSPLPIGAGQTISQPYVVARMTELLRAGYEAAGGAWDDASFFWWKLYSTLRWGLGLAGQVVERQRDGVVVQRDGRERHLAARRARNQEG